MTTARIRNLYLGALVGITTTYVFAPMPTMAALVMLAIVIGFLWPVVWTGSVDAHWRDPELIKPHVFETVLCWGRCRTVNAFDAPMQYLARMDEAGQWRCDVTDERLLPPDCWTRIREPVGAAVQPRVPRFGVLS